MTVLVVGASGATGRLLVAQLLEEGHNVRIVVRSTPHNIARHRNLSVTKAALLDLSQSELSQLVRGCDAVASCLGHNLTFKGLFGSPRRLVTEATQRLCSAIKACKPAHPVKFVLMNTVGNRNRDLNEKISFTQRCCIALIRLLIPPHADNENAAEYLRTQIGADDAAVQWSVVRPDNLLNEPHVSSYTIEPSPTRGPLFNPGSTSRINVAHFMANLIENESSWNTWKGAMPVIYNQSV